MHLLRLPRRAGTLAVGPDSIREVVFGVEDGVVQNLTLIAGMVGGGLSSAVIVFAGAINAIAGVLSMSMGTYLSSKAERDVALAVGDESAVPEGIDPRKDAFVMAAAYAIGALVPIVPFAFGFPSRAMAMGVAVVLALLTLFFLGYGKAVVSHQQRTRSGLEMLVLASAAGLIGFLLGAIAREVFGLDV
jgi:VIT1/CCC1 family predicted Fe2+/Mn2+ transporter